jgi:predicted N-acetyltransferase YhbS
LVSRPVPLDREHDLSQFQCGKPSLTDWLKKYALQSQKSGHTKTLVVVDEDNHAIAYYAYSVVSVEHGDATPARVKKGLARYSIPIFLIARLAVDVSQQGKGLGKRLLKHALKRAAKAAEKDVPIRAVVVDALDDDARRFYSQFDFEPWPVDSLRLWLLMKDLQATLKAAPAARKKMIAKQKRTGKFK